MAEERLIQLEVMRRPAQRKVYKVLAEKRLALKKNYLEEKGRNEPNAIGKYLSAISHNVVSSSLKGRVDDYEETRGNDDTEHTEGNDTSNWVPVVDKSSLEELDNPDPYAHRVVGLRDSEFQRKKCLSYKAGFNTRSNPVKCHGCDSWTHKKQICLKECSSNKQFYCKTCFTTNLKPVEPSQSLDEDDNIIKIPTGFKCSKCELKVKTKFSAKRHFENMHKPDTQVNDLRGETESITQSDESSTNTTEVKKDEFTLENVLKDIGLEIYIETFQREQINLEMLFDFEEEEFLSMFKDIGIGPFGHRRTLKKTIQSLKIQNSEKNITANANYPDDNEFVTDSGSIHLSTESLDSDSLQTATTHETNTSSNLLDEGENVDKAQSFVIASQTQLNQHSNNPNSDESMDLFLEDAPVKSKDLFLEDNPDEGPERFSLEEIAAESTSQSVSCKLCINSTQHFCRKCRMS